MISIINKKNEMNIHLSQAAMIAYGKNWSNFSFVIINILILILECKSVVVEA